ncbi:MAG: hypothetical protein JKY13_03685 [Gammaproteobacteria bacterium]|nr:hypothetical protein [Gammaproteobacteria bacterium]
MDAIASKAAAGLLPAVSGLQVGVVDKFVEDKKGGFFRVKVKLLSLGEKKNVIWARLGTFYASKEAGAFFIPEMGDEVIVGFFNDDPRQAVVLGSMYNPKNKPPEKMTKDNTKKGIIFDKKKAKILFDNKKDKENIIFGTSEKTRIFMEDKKIMRVSVEKESLEMKKDKGISLKTDKDCKIAVRAKYTLTAKKSVAVTGGKVTETAKKAFVIKGKTVDVK